jgi:hypothetical protein
MAPPLAQSSPPGKEEQARRESERRERFKKQKGGDEYESISGAIPFPNNFP